MALDGGKAKPLTTKDTKVHEGKPCFQSTGRRYNSGQEGSHDSRSASFCCASRVLWAGIRSDEDGLHGRFGSSCPDEQVRNCRVFRAMEDHSEPSGCIQRLETTLTTASRSTSTRSLDRKRDARTLLLGPEADAGMVLSSLGGDLERRPTCLKIRSYVVARDSKDSDSTHPVRYSTCQPSTRYRLKTTEMRTIPTTP